MRGCVCSLALPSSWAGGELRAPDARCVSGGEDRVPGAGTARARACVPWGVWGGGCGRRHACVSGEKSRSGPQGAVPVGHSQIGLDEPWARTCRLRLHDRQDGAALSLKGNPLWKLDLPHGPPLRQRQWGALSADAQRVRGCHPHVRAPLSWLCPEGRLGEPRRQARGAGGNGTGRAP